MSYKVHGIPMSTCTRRVLITLEELGAQYELIPVNFATGEHKSAEYMKTQQPFGQIPSFWDGDYHIFESRAIARYIASQSKNEYYPIHDAKKLGLVEQWISVESSNNKAVEGLVQELVFKPIFRKVEPDQAKVKEHKEALPATYNVLNEQLGKTKFLTGEHFTLADAVWMPYLQYVIQVVPDILEPYPNVQRWWNDISNRASWQSVLAMK